MSNDRKTRRTSRRVEVTNPDGTTTTYRSISQVAKALGKHAAQIYALATRGKVSILDNDEERDEHMELIGELRRELATLLNIDQLIFERMTVSEPRNLEERDERLALIGELNRSVVNFLRKRDIFHSLSKKMSISE